jgi:hypothetical protein
MPGGKLIQRTCAWIALSLLAVVANAQECPVIYDEHRGSTDELLFGKSQDVMCEDTVSDSSKAEAAASKAGLSVPVAKEILGLNFQGSNSSSDWSHWKYSFCHSQYREVASHFKQESLSKVFSDNALKAIQACYDRTVNAYFHVPTAGDSFVFSLRVAGKEKMASASLSPPDAVSGCDPENPFGLTFINRYIFDMDISGAPHEFGCALKDRTKSVILTVKLDNQGTRTFELSADPPPKPVPAKPLWCTEKVKVPLVVQAWVSEGVALVTGSNESYVGSPHGKGISTQKWLIKFDEDSYPNPLSNLGVEYRCQGAGYGWGPWKKGGEWCYDNVKQQTRMETIDIRLTGNAAKHFELSAQCVVQSIGEQNSTPLKEEGGFLRCGTVGRKLRLEELKLNVVSKGSCE